MVGHSESFDAARLRQHFAVCMCVWGWMGSNSLKLRCSKRYAPGTISTNREFWQHLGEWLQLEVLFQLSANPNEKCLIDCPRKLDDCGCLLFRDIILHGQWPHFFRPFLWKTWWTSNSWTLGCPNHVASSNWWLFEWRSGPVVLMGLWRITP